MTDLFLLEHWKQQAKEKSEYRMDGWASAETQRARMKRAIAYCNITNEDRVLDWGCGTALLASLLPTDDYFGADPSPAMRARAHKLRPNLSIMPLEEMDADHILALGCWNLKPWGPIRSYIQISHLWAYAGKSLCVAVRTKEDRQHVGHDERELVALARGLTEEWLLDASYHPREAMLVLYR